jgi:hypothetical protein
MDIDTIFITSRTFYSYRSKTVLSKMCEMINTDGVNINQIFVSTFDDGIMPYSSDQGYISVNSCYDEMRRDYMQENGDCYFELDSDSNISNDEINMFVDAIINKITALYIRLDVNVNVRNVEKYYKEIAYFLSRLNTVAVSKCIKIYKFIKIDCRTHTATEINVSTLEKNKMIIDAIPKSIVTISNYGTGTGDCDLELAMLTNITSLVWENDQIVPIYVDTNKFASVINSITNLCKLKIDGLKISGSDKHNLCIGATNIKHLVLKNVRMSDFTNLFSNLRSIKSLTIKNCVSIHDIFATVIHYVITRNNDLQKIQIGNRQGESYKYESKSNNDRLIDLLSKSKIKYMDISPNIIATPEFIELVKKNYDVTHCTFYVSPRPNEFDLLFNYLKLITASISEYAIESLTFVFSDSANIFNGEYQYNFIIAVLEILANNPQIKKIKFVDNEYECESQVSFEAIAILLSKFENLQSISIIAYWFKDFSEFAIKYLSNSNLVDITVNTNIDDALERFLNSTDVLCNFTCAGEKLSNPKLCENNKFRKETRFKKIKAAPLNQIITY